MKVDCRIIPIFIVILKFLLFWLKVMMKTALRDGFREPVDAVNRCQILSMPSPSELAAELFSRRAREIPVIF
jgi:hypothetical protein